MSIPSNVKDAIARAEIRARYDQFIGGEFRPPKRGQYFSNPTPITGQALCEVARGTAEDVEAALDAAHKAAPAWGKTSPAEPAGIATAPRRSASSEQQPWQAFNA